VFGWEDKFRRLLLRFERLSQLHYAFKTLASGLPSFLDCTEHLNENRLCNQHFSEPFDQGP
jgi:hypothetical protein